MINTITGVEMETAFGFSLPDYVHRQLEEANLKYHPLTDSENNALIARYMEDVVEGRGRFTPSGPEREGIWSDAWDGTLDRFKRSGYDPKSLSPPFIDKASHIRWNGRYVYAATPNLESRIYEIIRGWIFREIVAQPWTDCKLFEFGAGSCFNVATYCGMFPDRDAMALDWAPGSVEIAELLRQKCEMRVSGSRFDFFNPDYGIDLGDAAVVLTVGAIEQVGENFRPFLDYLLSKKPRRVVFVEPTVENYDSSKPFDQLAITYHKKRNYVVGLKPAIYELHQKGVVTVLEDFRTTLGSKYHEGYQVLAWEFHK